MDTSIRFTVTIILIVALATPLSAALYTWKDENGNSIISTSPPPGSEPASVSAETGAPSARVAEEKRVIPKPRAAATPTPVTASIRQTGEQGNYAGIRVILYKTDWCPYCKKARNELNALGVNPTEYDIERDRNRYEEMLAKGGTAVPFIDVEGIYVRGYSAAAIKAALDKKKSPQ
jgi:glutaredoxin